MKSKLAEEAAKDTLHLFAGMQGGCVYGGESFAYEEGYIDGAHHLLEIAEDWCKFEIDYFLNGELVERGETLSSAADLLDYLKNYCKGSNEK